MNNLPVPVISDAHYDRDNNRVVVTVEPCEGADFVSVWRTLNEPHPPMVWSRHLEPCDMRQTFYDYTCPLNTTATYAADSYSRAGDGDVIPHSDLSIPVSVSTADHRGWTKMPCVLCEELIWTPVEFVNGEMVVDLATHRESCPSNPGEPDV